MKNKIKILFDLFLKLDYRDKQNSGKKKITGIIISYIFANSALSFNLFNTFDKESFAILSFSTGIFLLSFIILNDYSNLFFSKQHLEFLRTLPLENNEVFVSKFLSAFVFVFFIQLTIILPQSVFYYFYEQNLSKTIIFIVANFSSNIFISVIILTIYTIALYYFIKKANILIYILQFVFFVYIMYSSSLTSRAMKYGKESLMSYGFTKFLPQYYFALSIEDYRLMIICLAACLLIIFLFYLFLKKRYYNLSEKIFSITDEIKKRRKLKVFSGLNNFINKNLLGNNLERASYYLIKNQLSNSRILKLRYIPLAFIPVIITMLGVFTNIPSFLYFQTGKDNILFTANSILMFSPSITITLVMCIRLMISNAKIADENSQDIGWIYESLPIESIKYFQNGVFKFIYINLIIPILILIFILLSFRINITPLVLNFAFIISVTLFLNSIISIFDKKMPFSLESTKYNSASRFGQIMLTVLAGIVIIVGQIFIFENVIFVIVSVAVFFIISVLLNYNKN